MQPTPAEHLFEYAILRFVPRVEREEFFNVGLVMMCKRRRWVRCQIHIDPLKYSAFATDIPLATLEAQLKGMQDIAHAAAHAGPIAALEPEERFRWISAMKSSCLQCSRPHPGVTTDLDATFARLFAEHIT